MADAHGSYSGETRFPLILQNVHRYFFWILLIFNCILTYDAILAFRQPGLGIGISVGTVVLCVNALFLWLYSLSCHACRHLCGGQVRSFAKHPVRYKLWKFVTPLNAKHMHFAWASLVVRRAHRPLRAPGGQRDDPRPGLPLLMAAPTTGPPRPTRPSTTRPTTTTSSSSAPAAPGCAPPSRPRSAACGSALVCKSLLGKAHTVMAEGGMAAAMGNV